MPYIGRNHITGDHTSNFKVLDDISSYTATFNGSSSSIVSTADETIRIPEHRFIQGQRVTYSNGGGGNIGGLTNGTAYFVTFDTANTFKLATSLANANNNTNINLSSVGSGSSHTLTAAFDGVNTTFKITHGGGSSADIVNSAQLQIAINNVIQKANLDSSYTEGFLVVDSRKIQFKTAPTADDIFWGNIIANTIETFDISDLKIDQFTGDGTTTQFTLSRDVPNNQSVMVTLDGVVQHPSDKDTTRAYRILADTVIEFSSPPGLSIEIQVRHLGFSGAATGDVSGFYGRTGNVVLGASDHITTGDITPRNINASGIITATSFIGSGAALTGIDATAIKDSGGNVKVQAQASGAVYTGIHTFTTLKSTSADFSGNVSIGGTLTYEDVTNIDSVGIITARNDLKVGTGVTITPAGAGFFSGIVTATSFTGDGANITGVAVTEAPVLSYEIFGPNNNQYFWWGGGVDVTEPNPDLFLQRGQMYRFVNNAGSAHPLEIRYAQSGPEFTSGVRGDKTGVQLFTVPYDAPAKLRYQCVPHTNMGGAIYIRGADGNQEKVGLTTFRNAINIQSDDSSPGRIRFYCEVNNIHYVTLKAPAHANFSGYPVVTLPNITGTLLTSNNANISGIVTATGADINGDLDVDGHTNLDNVSIAGVVTATSFVGDGSNLTGITGTTINNNADNRIITGSGTANTLEGEATFTYSGGTILNTNSGGDAVFKLSRNASVSDGTAIGTIDFCNNTGNTTNARVAAYASGGSNVGGHLYFETRDPSNSTLSEKLRITAEGELLLGSSFSSNINTFKMGIKESANENAAILFLDTDNMRGGICGIAKGTNELLTGTTNVDFVLGSLYSDTHIIYGQSGNQNGAIGMTVKGTTGHTIITEGLGVGNVDPGGSTLKVNGSLNLSAGGNTSWQKVSIEGSNNTAGDTFSMNNWGDAEGDYWGLMVNQTMNNSGNYSKTNSGKRTSFITLDGRMGRVYLGGASTSGNPTEHFYTNWDGTVYMNSGFGSVAPFYGVRAWVQGNSGTTNGSGGLSSMSRVSTGKYRLNFATTMPDDNYATGCLANNNYDDTSWHGNTETTSVDVHFYTGSSYVDPSEWSAWVIR